MSRFFRGVALVAALLAIAAGVTLFRRRAPSHTPTSARPAESDPAWCGKPIGQAAVGRLTDPGNCTTISLTGSAPTCFFWAECGEVHFEIDCSVGGEGHCRCDGDGRTVNYEPSFCALDPEAPKPSLEKILGSAGTACGWTPR